MADIHEDLLAVLDAVEIESPLRYSVRGASRDLQGVVPAEDSSPTDPTHFLSALATDLYERLYIRPSSSLLSEADALARRDLIAALLEANSGRGNWESGWTIRHVEGDGQVAVSRDDVAFWVATAGLHVEDGSIEPGTRCRVRIPKEFRGLIPGFYFAIGDEDGDRSEEIDPMGRYYWHLKPEAAVPFVAATTTILNGSRIPFRAKVLDDPRAYQRADAGVLFFRRATGATRSAHRSHLFNHRAGPSPGGPFLHETSGIRAGIRRGSVRLGKLRTATMFARSSCSMGVVQPR